MSATGSHDIARHWGHQVEVAIYGKPNQPMENCTIECVECGEVIIDGDTYDALWRDAHPERFAHDDD